MSSFTDTFGGTTVYSSEVSYRAVALTANVTLDWPKETAPTGDVLADILDVTPSGAGFTVHLPEANMASVGQTALFFNVGADSFIVADNGGNTVMAVAAGQAWQVYLTDNTTVNGVWRSYQYGAVTSVATAGSLIGAGIKAIGTTLNQAMSSTSLNTNYLAGDADRSEVFNWTGGAGTFSLPSAATVGNDWFVHLRNSGTGGLSIVTTVGGQNVNGSAALILNPGDSGILFSDGSNFFTIGLGKSASFAFDFVSISLTGQPSPYILAGANLNRVAYRFTGNITGNVQIVVPSTVQQYWVSNETDLASAPYAIEVKTLAGLGVTFARNERAILYCDGTDVIDADTAGISLPLSIAQGGTGATTDSGARINLGATATGNSLFTAGSASSARATLGASVVGDAVFVAADAAAARTAIGAQASLGYTPVNIAGDTMTGALRSTAFWTPVAGGLTIYGGSDSATGLAVTPATSLVALRTAGSDRLTISAAGAVAIPGTLAVTGAVTLTSTIASAGFWAPAGGGLTIFGGNDSAAGMAVTPATSIVALRTAGSDRLTISAAGAVAIGGTLAAGATSITGAVSATSAVSAPNFFCSAVSGTYGISGGTRVDLFGTGSGSNQILSYVNSTLVSSIDASGNFTATGNITANSDRKLKADIEPLTGSLDAILAMQGVRYTRISDGSRQIGLIAQDVEAVRPEYVHADSEGTKSLAYANIVADLIEAVKTLSARVVELEAR